MERHCHVSWFIKEVVWRRNTRKNSLNIIRRKSGRCLRSVLYVRPAVPPGVKSGESCNIACALPRSCPGMAPRQKLSLYSRDSMRGTTC